MLLAYCNTFLHLFFQLREKKGGLQGKQRVIITFFTGDMSVSEKYLCMMCIFHMNDTVSMYLSSSILISHSFLFPLSVISPHAIWTDSIPHFIHADLSCPSATVSVFIHV